MDRNGSDPSSSSWIGLRAGGSLQKAEIRADQDEIDAILYTFDQAEEALQAKNLSVIMTIYSDGYQNRGLRKGILPGSGRISSIDMTGSLPTTISRGSLSTPTEQRRK